MPVNDFNATKMGIEAVSIFETTEEVSGFWEANPEIVSFVLVGITFAAIFLFLLFYLGKKFTNILHK